MKNEKIPVQVTSRSASTSHVGRVRAQNQDAVLADDDKGLWLVLDGLGGHAGGETASRLARDTIAREVASGSDVEAAIQAAHQAICEAQQETSGKEEMGTTVVALAENDARYTIHWVGDSRAYRFVPHTGKLELLTRDHNLAGLLMESGAMDAEQARYHPQKHVLTECLGLAGRSLVRCDQVEGQWEPDDIILLCSDGLTNELADVDLAPLLGSNPELQPLTELLLEKALSAGGRDNVSLILVRAPDQVARTGPWWKLW